VTKKVGLLLNWQYS